MRETRDTFACTHPAQSGGRAQAVKQATNDTHGSPRARMCALKHGTHAAEDLRARRMTCCDGAPHHSRRELPTVCLLSLCPVTVFIPRCQVHVAPHSSIQVCTGPSARSLMYNQSVLVQACKKVPGQRGQRSLHLSTRAAPTRALSQVGAALCHY